MATKTLDQILADSTLSNYGKMYEIASANEMDGLAYPGRYVITNSEHINPTQGKQRLGRKDHALAYAKLAAEDGLPDAEVLDSHTQTWLD